MRCLGMKKMTAFSMADKLEEAGDMVVARRSASRKHERVIHYEAANMIRSLAIRLHRERSLNRTLKLAATVLLGVLVALVVAGA